MDTAAGEHVTGCKKDLENFMESQEGSTLTTGFGKTGMMQGYGILKLLATAGGVECEIAFPHLWYAPGLCIGCCL